MKKILIVGGSHSEIPLVNAAKELGLYTITSGNQQHGLAHKYSDEFHLCDYSDKEKVLELAQELKVDYICFGAHDFSYLSTVYTAHKLSIPFFDTNETALILHHKDKFKEFCKTNNIKTVKAYSFDSFDSAIEFANKFTLPFMIKPIDLGGGKGVLKIVDKNQINDAIKNAFAYSKSKRIIIEDFFKGTLHSFSAFLANQKIKFFFEDTEIECANNPYGVCTSISPTVDFYQVKQALITEIEKIASLLTLKDGLLHCQYLKNGEDFSIIELTRRMPGDMYNIPVETSTNFQYAKNIIRQCIGEKLEFAHTSQDKFVSRHCIVGNGKVEVGSRLKNYIIQQEIWGDTQNIEKQGILFLQYPSHQEMIEVTDKLSDLNFIILQTER